MRSSVLILLYISVLLCWQVQAVDRKKFRTCDQTAFCKRNRATGGDAARFVPQDYALKVETVVTSNQEAALVADLQNGKWPLQDPLECTIKVLELGTVRLSIREKSPLHPRFVVKDVLLQGAETSHSNVDWTVSETSATGTIGDGSVSVLVTFNPFNVELQVKGVSAVQANGNGLMNLEAYRPGPNPRPDGETGDGNPATNKFPYDSDDMWSTSFDGKTDTIPYGPAAIAMDVAFPGSQYIYGIPEHASSFALKNTDNSGNGAYGEPYRLWNLDVFEYELDEAMALYGAVPFVMAHSTAATTGALWLNAAETYIDIFDQDGHKVTHWISETGVIDLFMMPGPTPADVWGQYAALTGAIAMPQKFAIGYHQCRWNYKSQDDVAQVDDGFDEFDIPYDVIWLDIEHTDSKKYFTWDSSNFPDPPAMQNEIAEKGRKMVTIIDPHIKRESGYYVHQKANNNDYYVMDSKEKGGVYEGWCWPGSVSYLDFLRSEVRDYWAGLFALDKYEGSTQTLYTWNDMNEPSVFNGPEVTMPKDCLHMNGLVEHRDAHNMYGFYHQWATEMGQIKRDNARPFVLTRSFFAGSQRYGAVWTGDNEAKWSHLEAATPMLLSLNLGGITFSGADVGGFFGDPEVELLVRWYQAAAFQPFFRGHAHIDAKRREPWLFGEPYTTHIRNAIRSRYRILPYVYTTFAYSNMTGVPIMRPLWAEFPADKATFGMDTQFLLGNGIMVKPVAMKDATSTSVYFPGTQPWYDFWYGVQVNTAASQKPGRKTFNTESLDTIPVFLRGGVILPTKERARRSSTQMVNDPLTLTVALDNDQRAAGEIYMDDGHTFNHLHGGFLYRSLKFEGNTLTSSIKAAPNRPKPQDSNVYSTIVEIERVMIWGAKQKYTEAVLTSSSMGTVRLAVRQSDDFSHTIIRKPAQLIQEDFTIRLE